LIAIYDYIPQLRAELRGPLFGRRVYAAVQLATGARIPTISTTVTSSAQR
jgi:hypothetical protein